MKTKNFTILAQCGSVFVLLLVIWVGSYLGLRHFCESPWSRLIDPAAAVTKPVDVHPSVLPATVVYHPLVFADEKITGERVEFSAQSFGVALMVDF